MAHLLEDTNLIDINLNKLIEEWAAQARLYKQEADKLVTLERDYDEKKAAVDIAEEEVKYVMATVEQAFRIRPNPAVERITESVVSSYVTTSREVRTSKASVWTAVKERDDAKQLAGYQRATVRALEHRKEALENAVKLRLNDFYAEPRAPRGAGDLARKIVAEETLKRCSHTTEESLPRD